MPPVITYTGGGAAAAAASADIKGTLFTDKKFFITQRTPQRARYVEDVVANGGAVVKLEQQADYIIADHLRTDAPAGSLSYTFIETAIRDGGLPPEANHRAGRAKGTVGTAASSFPRRAGRTPFTAKDDQDLYKWVKEAEVRGASIKGQELYKQFEAMNSRHTWQSWRERYVKNLAFNPPAVLPEAAADQEASAPAASPVQPQVQATPSQAQQTPSQGQRLPSQVRKASSKVGQTPSKAGQTPSSQAEPSIARQNKEAIESSHAEPAAPSNDLVPTTATPNHDLPADIDHADTLEHNTDVMQIDVMQASDMPADKIAKVSIPGFEDENPDPWLQGAKVIQQIPVGQYNHAWIALAVNYPDHTAVEFRTYYEQVILPVYLDKEEKNQEMPKVNESALYRNILATFGTQGQPIPHLLERSSENETSPVAAPGTATTGLAPYKAPQPTVQPTSKVNDGEIRSPASQVQFNRQQRTTHRGDIATEFLAHSTLQHRRASDAHAPLLADNLSKRKPAKSSNADENSPKRQRKETSAARTPLESDQSTIIKSKSKLDMAIQDDEKTPVSDNELVQTQIRQEMRANLTAENLAIVEAENAPRQDKRALDIVPDDDMKDQGAYAGYLEQLLQAGGQFSKEGIEALKEKHGQADELTREDKTHGRDEEGAEQHSRPEDLNDKDLNNGFSSPLRLAPSDRLAPLDPDISPTQSPDRVDTRDINSEVSDDESDVGDIQLGVAEPEGGWSTFSSQSSQLPRPGASDKGVKPAAQYTVKGKGKTRAMDTQEIFDADTQALDLDVPKPSSRFRSPKRRPQTATESQEMMDADVMSEEDIRGFVESNVRLGHAVEDVMTALYRSSIRRVLCEVALESISAGRGIPTDVPGIWSVEEDEWAESEKADLVKRAEQKHGGKECDARREFLMGFRE